MKEAHPPYGGRTVLFEGISEYSDLKTYLQNAVWEAFFARVIDFKC